MSENTRASKLDRLLRRQGEMADQLSGLQSKVSVVYMHIPLLIYHCERLLRENETLKILVGIDEIERKLKQANAFLAEPLREPRCTSK